MKNLLIQAWLVHRFDDEYYLPYTHWIYLNEIVKYYDQICLLAPTYVDQTSNVSLVPIGMFTNVRVEELPFSDSYVKSIKHFPKYFSTYKRLRGIDVSYARYPIPFGWLQKLLLKRTKRIVHFVGDPIDAAMHNPNFNFFKKFSLVTLFFPEHLMYIWACKGAKVYTNGFHIADRLKKYSIKATSLISSTLNSADFFYDSSKNINSENPKILYVGYLRKAKGVETVINSFRLLQVKYPNATLTIVGSGEFLYELKKIISDNNIKNVNFLGHVDDRTKLNKIIRSHDIFCFASLSEGSPRVILEAMANGINVVSTPVGALPHIFKSGVHLLFADFNDEKDFCNKMDILISNKITTNILSRNAYEAVKTYTIENFIKQIFYED